MILMNKRWYRLHSWRVVCYLIVSSNDFDDTRDDTDYTSWRVVFISLYHKWFDDTRDDTDYTSWRVVCIISLYHQMILMTQEMIQTTFMTCSLLSHCVIKWFWWHKRWYRLHVMTCSLYLIVSQMILMTQEINTLMTLVCLYLIVSSNDFDDTRDDTDYIHDV